MSSRSDEIVSCAAVGDTAVGKTSLLMTTPAKWRAPHLPFANSPPSGAYDYRLYHGMLIWSYQIVDQIDLIFRLYEAFEDNTSVQTFELNSIDVFLLCFSIGSPTSLQNCKTIWYPEIRRFYGDVPVILVGCQNDLRYRYIDETYISHSGERNTFVMPDEARAVATELGILYYESSVHAHFGVKEVFENAIRSALIARRQKMLQKTNLVKVQKPLLQAPFRPPKPSLPDFTDIDGNFRHEMLDMLTSRSFTDIVLIVGATKFPVHKFMLTSASALFSRLLNNASLDIGGESTSEPSTLSSTFEEATAGNCNDDTEYLVWNESRTERIWEHLKPHSTYQAVLLAETESPNDLYKNFHHPIIQNIRTVHIENEDGININQTVITFARALKPQIMEQCLKFIYTGTIEMEYNLEELREASDYLELPQLALLLSESNNDLASINEPNQYPSMKENMENICMGNGSCTDVTFELDDGRMKAHRALLVARCDAMHAMLAGDFVEARSNVIAFSKVTTYSFHKLLSYLYTDEIPPIPAERCLSVLELANRLCLPRFLNLIERRVIEDLNMMSKNETTEAVEAVEAAEAVKPVEAAVAVKVIDHCLKLLEPAKLHNAHQLAEWCTLYLCVNYDIICKFSLKGLEALHPDNQEYLRARRWPPEWYNRDYDYYQRCMSEKIKDDLNKTL